VTSLGRCRSGTGELRSHDPTEGIAVHADELRHGVLRKPGGDRRAQVKHRDVAFRQCGRIDVADQGQHADDEGGIEATAAAASSRWGLRVLRALDIAVHASVRPRRDRLRVVPCSMSTRANSTLHVGDSTNFCVARIQTSHTRAACVTAAAGELLDREVVTWSGGQTP
jgi:hypothetical protein